MILISLGTHQQPFPRALDLVEPLAGGDEQLVIQHGHTPARPQLANTEWVRSMPYEELVEMMTRARSVVCHAGVGTIMTALKAGHTPVVIPRQLVHGEHVDDHQLDIATQFAEKGLIRCVTFQTDMKELLHDRHAASGPPIGRGRQELRAAVSEAAERRRRGRPMRASSQ